MEHVYSCILHWKSSEIQIKCSIIGLPQQWIFPHVNQLQQQHDAHHSIPIFIVHIFRFHFNIHRSLYICLNASKRNECEIKKRREPNDAGMYIVYRFNTVYYCSYIVFSWRGVICLWNKWAKWDQESESGNDCGIKMVLSENKQQWIRVKRERFRCYCCYALLFCIMNWIFNQNKWATIINIFNREKVYTNVA